MAARNPARYLAPLALLATIVGIYLVVHAALSANSSSPRSSAILSGPRRRRARQKFYVVAPGDSMSTIAAKTGVALTTLEALNPGVDPGAIQAGQRLRLRR